VSASGLAVRGSAYAADRDFKEGLVRAVARPGAAAGRNSIPDYACRRSLRAVVDAGSIPAASIILLNHALFRARRVELNARRVCRNPARDKGVIVADGSAHRILSDRALGLMFVGRQHRTAAGRTVAPCRGSTTGRGPARPMASTRTPALMLALRSVPPERWTIADMHGRPRATRRWSRRCGKRAAPSSR
jgi:hypothetical protein